MKIGIPRGLSFYSIYPFMFGFFKAMGIEIDTLTPEQEAYLNSWKTGTSN